MRFLLAAVVFGVGLLATTAQAVTIETVPVGNAGNATDARYGGSYGSVGYDYQIGDYEVDSNPYQ